MWYYTDAVWTVLIWLTGGWWRWALVSPDGVAPSWMVGVSASVNLLLHHKVQKFFSGTGSPGWSRKKGRKTVVWFDLQFIVKCHLQALDIVVISVSSPISFVGSCHSWKKIVLWSFKKCFDCTNAKCVESAELQYCLKIEMLEEQLQLYVSCNKRKDMHSYIFLFLFVTVASVRTDVCRCNLCWKDETTLIIGWAKSIKVWPWSSCFCQLYTCFVLF